MYFFLTEVTHDGPTIVDHRPCVPVWRSAPLGLSLVWLCSLRPWRGATDYSHRAAPHWPTLKGPHRPPPAGAPSGCPNRHPEEERVCFRRKMAHSLKGTYEGASWHGISWRLSSALALVLGMALATPAGAAMPEPWITTKTKTPGTRNWPRSRRRSPSPSNTSPTIRAPRPRVRCRSSWPAPKHYASLT